MNPDLNQSRREHQRRQHLVQARLMVGARWYDTRIADMSVGGAKLEIEVELSGDPEVWVELGQFGKFRAEIVWQHGSTVGIRFLHDPAEVAEVIMGMATYGY